MTSLLKDKIETVFGSSFNTNGLGAVLTCGVTGLKAGLSHSPICTESGRERCVGPRCVFVCKDLLFIAALCSARSSPGVTAVQAGLAWSFFLRRKDLADVGLPLRSTQSLALPPALGRYVSFSYLERNPDEDTPVAKPLPLCRVQVRFLFLPAHCGGCHGRAGCHSAPRAPGPQLRLRRPQQGAHRAEGGGREPQLQGAAHYCS